MWITKTTTDSFVVFAAEVARENLGIGAMNKWTVRTRAHCELRVVFPLKSINYVLIFFRDFFVASKRWHWIRNKLETKILNFSARNSARGWNRQSHERTITMWLHEAIEILWAFLWTPPVSVWKEWMRKNVNNMFGVRSLRSTRDTSQYVPQSCLYIYSYIECAACVW